MITNIYSTSPFVTANSIVAGPYINSGSPSAGMMRYHNQQVQVYDGSSWLAMSSTANVGLSGEAEEIMNWARGKMAEEARVKELADKHPTVADALLARDRAEDAVRIAVALCDTK